jgi:single-strand DNA-binding protein
MVRDAELRDAGSSKVAKFTIATTSYFRKADGTKGKEVTFVPCEAWDSGGETIAQHIKKGHKILIEGELKMDTWEDKATGAKRSQMKVRVSTFEHWAPKVATESQESQPQETNEEAAAPADPQGEEDIPF